MKKITLAILLCAALIGVTGCNTTQQTMAYKSLFSLESTTLAAYNGYLASIIKGQTSTNSLPQVSHLFNDFQASALPVLDTVQYSTNVFATANLVTESADLINLITTVKGK